MFIYECFLPVRGLLLTGPFSIDFLEKIQEYVGKEAYLTPENTNPHDEFAVGIFVKKEKKDTNENWKLHIGYIPRERSERFHHFLCNKGEYKANIEYINSESKQYNTNYLFIKVCLKIQSQDQFDDLFKGLLSYF